MFTKKIFEITETGKHLREITEKEIAPDLEGNSPVALSETVYYCECGKVIAHGGKREGSPLWGQCENGHVNDIY